jgi:hypothetical protein
MSHHQTTLTGSFDPSGAQGYFPAADFGINVKAGLYVKHDIDGLIAEYGQDLRGEGCSYSERSAVEVWDFVTKPPERYFAYVFIDNPWPSAFPEWKAHWAPHRVSVGTWTGDSLSVGPVMLGKVWRSNMGDMRRSVRFKAINGYTYAGTLYLSAGDYCRIKQVKG